MNPSKSLFLAFFTCTLIFLACSNQNSETEQKPGPDSTFGQKDSIDNSSIKESNNCNQLTGSIRSSAQWGSGWIDLANATSFRNGDTLKIGIGGTARNILVRLLPQGADPGSPNGLLDGAKVVPPNKLITVVLNSNHNNVIQISIHGNPNPWNISLGTNNGPAMLVSVVVCQPQQN